MNPQLFEWKQVNSSAIDRIAYSAEHRMLAIQFHSGMQYAYLDVPPSVWAGLNQAESKGTFHNVFLARNFDYTRID